MDIHTLLKAAIRDHASDLHILPAMAPQVRVYGTLQPLSDFPVFSPEEAHTLVMSLMTEEQQARFERELVIDFAASFEGIGYVRVSALHQLKGLAAVMRLVPVDVPSFESLSLPLVIKRLLVLHYGLILVTGPTGSGKSTTLAAMIDDINANQSGHIITIEDPIEYVHHPKMCAVTQLQIGRDTPSAAIALRAALRQDPDVILLGEMRDLETISLALTAAETGHLVLATLHASSAPLAISRIIDVFPEAERSRVRNILAETLQAIVFQTLVRKIPNGLAAAFELLLSTPAVRHHIRQGMSTHLESAMQTGGDIGMCTLEQYLQKMVAQHVISQATARSMITNREGFKALND